MSRIFCLYQMVEPILNLAQQGVVLRWRWVRPALRNLLRKQPDGEPNGAARIPAVYFAFWPNDTAYPVMERVGERNCNKDDFPRSDRPSDRSYKSLALHRFGGRATMNSFFAEHVLRITRSSSSRNISII